MRDPGTKRSHGARCRLPLLFALVVLAGLLGWLGQGRAPARQHAIWFGLEKPPHRMVRQTLANAALAASIRRDDVEAAMAHLGHGADPNMSVDGTRPVLACAVQARAPVERRMRLVEALLAAGAQVDGRDATTGRTALFDACEANQLPLVKLLLSRGANVNARDHGGETPLSFATAYREWRLEVMELLIASGADVNAADDEGFTPLMSAAQWSEEYVRVLLDHGAKVNARNRYGLTALSTGEAPMHPHAGRPDCPQALVLLRQRGATH